MKEISIIAFDDFTDIDLWLMWDLLNRVKGRGWKIRILGEKSTHISQTKINISMHGNISEANTADAVLFISGPGTRNIINQERFLSSFQLNPQKQLIGSICSGALILAKLGILKSGDTATTYPTAKTLLENFNINIVEEPFVSSGNIATAAGCLSAQYLVGWVIEKLADKQVSDIVLGSIQPMGNGLFFNSSLESLSPAFR